MAATHSSNSTMLASDAISTWSYAIDITARAERAPTSPLGLCLSLRFLWHAFRSVGLCETLIPCYIRPYCVVGQVIDLTYEICALTTPSVSTALVSELYTSPASSHITRTRTLCYAFPTADFCRGAVCCWMVQIKRRRLGFCSMCVSSIRTIIS